MWMDSSFGFVCCLLRLLSMLLLWYGQCVCFLLVYVLALFISLLTCRFVLLAIVLWGFELVLFAVGFVVWNLRLLCYSVGLLGLGFGVFQVLDLLLLVFLFCVLVLSFGF